MATKKKVIGSEVSSNGEVVKKAPVRKKTTTLKKKVVKVPEVVEQKEEVVLSDSVEETVEEMPAVVETQKTKQKKEVVPPFTPTPRKNHPIFKDLFQGVEHLSVEEVFLEQNFPDHYSSVVMITDKNKPVNFTGSAYKLITNEELMLPTYTQICQIFGAENIEVKTINYDDSYYVCQIAIKGKTFQIEGRDYVTPKVMIENSYNSAYRYRVSLYFERVLTETGLWGMSMEFTTPKKHVKNAFYNLQDLKEKIDTSKKLVDLIKSTFVEKKLDSFELDAFFEDFVQKPFASLPKNIVPKIQTWLSFQKETFKIEKSVWSLYTSFNHVINNDLWDVTIAEKRDIDVKVRRELVNYFNLEFPKSLEEYLFDF